MGNPRIRVLIADDMVELRSNVRRMLSSQEGMMIVGESGDGEEALRHCKELQPHVVLMDINMPKLDGMKVTETLSKEHPEIQVVIMSIQSEQEYFRRAMKVGAKDFLTKPFSTSDLVDAITNVYNKWIKDRPEYNKVEVVKSKVITLFATKGGVGRTTLAVNLASSLSQKGKRTLLIDGSLQFGDVGIALNMNSSKNIYNALEKSGVIDLNQLEKNIQIHQPTGLEVLLAPSDPAFAEALKGTHIKQVLELLSGSYRYIVVDTPPHIQEVELALFDRTDLLLLVATLEISSLKNTKLCLKTLSDIKYETAKIKLLLNKDIPNVGISAKEIEDKLAIPMFGVVPMDSETVQLSLNQGEPFVVKSLDSRLTTAVFQITEKILSHFDDKPSAAPKKVSAFFKIKELIMGS